MRRRTWAAASAATLAVTVWAAVWHDPTVTAHDVAVGIARHCAKQYPGPRPIDGDFWACIDRVTNRTEDVVWLTEVDMVDVVGLKIPPERMESAVRTDFNGWLTEGWQP